MTTTLTGSIENKTPGKAALIATRVLSIYPLIGTLGVLLGGLLKIKFIVWLAVASWVVNLYIGSLVWFGLIIYLAIKKRISPKELLLQVLIISIGIASACYVVVNDTLGSGAKYID
jgi:hypothetical protein